MNYPILVVGDSPSMPTGLSRIARDICSILLAMGFKVAQLGLGYDGSPWPWRVYPLQDEEHWGAGDLQQVMEWHSIETQGKVRVVLTAWDPGRCFDIAHSLPPRSPDDYLQPEWRARLWGYFAIDGVTDRDSLSDSAIATLARYDRVLAYGRWGSEVIKRATGVGPVPYLPHGLDLSTWKPMGVNKSMIGCVAANQPRKDLGLLFRIWEQVAQEMPQVKFWLHTDRPITEAWNVPQLAADHGLNSSRLVLTTALSDYQLAVMYSRCWATVAPGLGEGFGYPIVESLACGTPVVHGDYAGGAELVPLRQWRVPYYHDRLMGSHAITRPLFDTEDFMSRLGEAVQWMEQEREVCEPYCTGAVAHLDWTYLRGRWETWIRKGIQEMEA